VNPIYWDYNATTPPDPGVRQAMEPYLETVWGNPSSVHAVGRRARAALDDFRYRLSALWRCRPSEVVFTGGGTESNNLAVLGTARLLAPRGRRHLVASPVEHHAVLHALRCLEAHEGFTVTMLPVDALGRVSPESVAEALRPDTALVSVMAANNETGTLQPVAAIGRLCRERGVIFHTDAVQAFGKLPFERIDQFEADLVSVCAHKFHGPKGAGALFIRSPLLPHPTQHGGAQENERRGGTENLAAVAGLVSAFEAMVPEPVFPADRLRAWTARMARSLAAIPGVEVHGCPEHRLPNTLAFSVEGTDSISLLANLDLEGVCASSGSACTAGSVEPSHVLRAMGVPESRAKALVRFSLGRGSTEDEVSHVERLLPDLIARCRG
jgi:cysteine desulfurase